MLPPRCPGTPLTAPSLSYVQIRRPTDLYIRNTIPNSDPSLWGWGYADLRIHGVLRSSAPPLCHSAHTSPSHRSMLASLRGLLTLREGAGLLPALLLDWDSLPSRHQPREEEQPLHPGGKQARVPNHVPSQLPRRSPWQSRALSSTTRSPSTPSNSGRRARTQAARCCSSTTTTRPTASVPCRTAIRSKKRPSRS